MSIRDTADELVQKVYEVHQKVICVIVDKKPDCITKAKDYSVIAITMLAKLYGELRELERKKKIPMQGPGKKKTPGH